MSAGGYVAIEGAVKGTPFECGQQIGLRVILSTSPQLPGQMLPEFARGLLSAALATLQARCGSDFARQSVDQMLAASAHLDPAGSSH